MIWQPRFMWTVNAHKDKRKYRTVAGTVYVINNTMECGPDSAPSSSCLVCATEMSRCYIRNNHLITSSGSSIGNTSNSTIDHNLTQSKTDANAENFTSLQPYHFSPTVATNSTVGMGINSANLIPGPAAALCQDTTYGVLYDTSNHTATKNVRAVKNRPTTGLWDIGAYMFQAEPFISVPKNLRY